MSAQDRTQVRETAKEVIQRAIQDAAFADQLRSDPETTLKSVGFPAELINDFIVNDLGLEGEVAGYRGCEESCLLITCNITVSCGNTVAG